MLPVLLQPSRKEWKDIEDVPKHMKDEVVHFMNAYKDTETPIRCHPRGNRT